MADQIARGRDTSPRLDNPLIPAVGLRPICWAYHLHLPPAPMSAIDSLRQFFQNSSNPARKSILRILRDIMEERRNSLMKNYDMLDYLLKEEDPRYKLNDEEILDQVVMILYLRFGIISTTSMMVIKYLRDHPSALKEIRDEHFTIRGRKRPEEPLDWNDYKSMIFTRAVIFETSRLATVVNGVLRKTTEGMELNGYFIPRRWRIYVYTREINYDPFL